ncbi:hypothetical protein [Streptomyces europaeiscabiei]|uniref:hypothetical protein n=1 Tax=Streptomyces europaeiscabiei TaxID=146819 RepID=UPI0029A70FB2|nr:hypothetical protein [Streptomyces europaeiscabiei]MDX3845286.1 hypothetical protein [Streptomyces europaeiscabiei]
MTDALTEAPAASPSGPPPAKVVADDALTVAAAPAAEFRAGAPERDADRRLPRAELDRLSASGLSASADVEIAGTLFEAPAPARRSTPATCTGIGATPAPAHPPHDHRPSTRRCAPPLLDCTTRPAGRSSTSGAMSSTAPDPHAAACSEGRPR